MIGAVIQARMGSTRLPGKILMDLCGHPVLWHVINRVRQVPEIKKVIVATSKEPADDIVAQKCREWGAAVYRGPEDDVLERFYRAAALQRVTGVVRVTADCPLLDPNVISQVVQHFVRTKADYCSNVHPPTFPDGLDVEVLSIRALEAAWAETSELFDREHVTPYIWSQPGRFRMENVQAPQDYSHLRWTVDTQEDLDTLRVLLARVPEGTTDYRKLL